MWLKKYKYVVCKTNWASDHVSNIHATIGAILRDPRMILDALVLSSIDAIEEDGIGYAIGYVGFNVATTVLTAGKAKTAKIKKLLARGNWDELMRMGATADDLIRAGASLDEITNFLRAQSVKNRGADTATLGRFTGGADSYNVRAGDTSFFDMGSDWNVVRNNFNLSNTEMFDLFNRPFLDDMIANGQTIRFSHDPRVTPLRAGFLEAEWAHIKDVLNITDANLIFEGGFWYVNR